MDGFSVAGRRRGRQAPMQDRDLESFHRSVPRYPGSDEDYAREHAHHYGRDEHLTPDGRHPPGKPRFPRGSDREKRHAEYSRSTKLKENAHNAYEAELDLVDNETKRFSRSQSRYYDEYTGGRAPDHHERLEPLARNARDKQYSNATLRDNFLRAHPRGYHTRRDHDKHYGWAEEAYQEYELNRDRQKHHEDHRSFSSIDSRRDKWGRPMSHRR